MIIFAFLHHAGAQRALTASMFSSRAGTDTALSGSPRDGNQSPDLKGNAPLPDAARVAVACAPTGASALRRALSTWRDFCFFHPGRPGAAPASAPHGK
ncbi:hypothetical protein SB30_230203 [Klebsiella quasipneumoniae subsp. similipneumoniae]|nr:hypothetical protein SB30_230203 [Klebsiella quasipneumoniae subsp. similipneumoniae]